MTLYEQQGNGDTEKPPPKRGTHSLGAPRGPPGCALGRKAPTGPGWIWDHGYGLGVTAL